MRSILSSRSWPQLFFFLRRSGHLSHTCIKTAVTVFTSPVVPKPVRTVTQTKEVIVSYYSQGKISHFRLKIFIAVITHTRGGARGVPGGATAPSQILPDPPVAPKIFQVSFWKSYTDHWQLPLLQNWPLQWPPKWKCLAPPLTHTDQHCDFGSALPNDTDQHCNTDQHCVQTNNTDRHRDTGSALPNKELHIIPRG